MTYWRLQQNLQTMNRTSLLLPLRFSFMTTDPESWTMANWIHLPISTFDSLRLWWLRKSTSHLNDNSRSSYKFCLLQVRIQNVCPLISVDKHWSHPEGDLHHFWREVLQFITQKQRKMTLRYLKDRVDKPRNKQACGKKVGEVAGVSVPALGRLWWGGWSYMGRLTLGKKKNGTGETKFKWDSNCFLLRNPLL